MISTRKHWKINRYTSVASTQDLALADARRVIAGDSSAPDIRTAYVADVQTDGRGQHGRKWCSPEGGLYLSMLFPDAPLAVQGRLPLAIGVAVAITIERLGVPKAMIRWPNDVLISGKKVAGVLSQTLSAGSRSAAVAGVGLNLNTDPAILCSELSQYALSVMAFLCKKIDPDEALIILLEQVDIFVNHLLMDRWEVLHAELKLRDALHGCIVSLLSTDQKITGKADGISDNGGLKILMPDGVNLFSSATVQTVDGRPVRFE